MKKDTTEKNEEMDSYLIKFFIYNTQRKLISPNKKTINLIKKWAVDTHRRITKEDVRMVNGHVSGCWSSLVIGKVQVETQREVISHPQE
jgi:hypothetical protein